MTPTTSVAPALPIDRMPCGDKVTPLGNAAPADDTPNVPPLATPLGSVAAKSILAPLPTMKYSEPTFHAPTSGAGGGGDGFGLGDGPGAGDGAGPEPSDRSVESSPEPPHPARAATHPNRPIRSAKATFCWSTPKNHPWHAFRRRFWNTTA